MTSEISPDVLGRLRAVAERTKTDGEIRGIIEAKDEVLARYSPMFQPAVIGQITEEVLRSFLYFENNKHWTGLNRQVNRVCANMDATRAALTSLVDEDKPLETRMNPAVAIKGLGKGIITAILHVAYPDHYGVWNNTSEAALVELGLMPSISRGASFGARYEAINDVLRKVANALEVDLWTLDALWWRLDVEDSELTNETTSAERDSAAVPATSRLNGKGTFALERHLHLYLFDNWDNLSIATDWELYAPPGDPEAGYEFATPIGRIDLLARHRREPRWLVVELKRHGTSDQVVGQVLRYIGWIKAHHAEPGETVEGLIVASEGDPQLHYAVSAVQGLSFMAYEVEFHLRDGPTFTEFSKP